MRIILLGPPGAGKGTQAARIAARIGVPHIATGDLLRRQVAAGTELGKRAKSFMDAGDYVPDELMLEMLRERLSQPDAREGFVLDGFPRTHVQAEALDRMLEEATGTPIDHVIVLDAPDEEIVKRIAARRTCLVCGRSYNLVSSPPNVDSICDEDGSNLQQRTDESEDVVRRRMAVYHEKTQPLIDYYAARGLVRGVEGLGSLEEVEKRILEATT